MNQINMFETSGQKIEERCPECNSWRGDICGVNADRIAPCRRFYAKEERLDQVQATHQVFNSRLFDSEPARQLVAKILRDQGNDVVAPQLQYSNDYYEARKLRDEADIIINGYHLEVKHLRKYRFTGPHDWTPAPWWIVCDVSRWIEYYQRSKFPVAIICLNKDKTHFGWTSPKETANKMDTEPYENWNKEMVDKFRVKMDLVHFNHIEELTWSLISGPSLSS